MDLFVLTNFFTILSSESLIDYLECKKGVAIIEDINEEYYNNMVLNVNKSKWDKIYKLNVNSYKIPLNKKKPLSKENYFLYKTMKEEKKRIKKIIEENNIKQIFMPHGADYRQHNLIYLVAREKNIPISLYEEGLNFYLLAAKNENKQLESKANIIKKILGHSPMAYYFVDDEKYENKKTYSLLKRDGFIKYPLSIDFIRDEEIINKYKEIKNLYLSQPFSEDNILNFDEEIKLFNKFLDKANINEITLKYHPRDSKEKREEFERILKERKIILNNFEELNVPAEKILGFLCDECKIFGFTSSTLVYASEIFNLKVFSLADSLIKIRENKIVRECIEVFKENFKNILYI